MPSDDGPVQLDANVIYQDKPPGATKKRKKRSGVFTIAAVGALLAIALLVYQPENARFIDSPPPEEQEERDSIASVASQVVLLLDLNDSLPSAEELHMPSGYHYMVEDDSLWSIETPGGLYYTSDMDIRDFQEGRL